jgi:hypothetical protein
MRDTAVTLALAALTVAMIYALTGCAAVQCITKGTNACGFN